MCIRDSPTCVNKKDDKLKNILREALTDFKCLESIIDYRHLKKMSKLEYQWSAKIAHS